MASHHGRREFGSPVEPATPEAFALHHIDNLDSKLGQLRNLRRGGAEGLQYVRALGRTVYFDRPEAEDGEAAEGVEPAAD